LKWKTLAGCGPPKWLTDPTDRDLVKWGYRRLYQWIHSPGVQKWMNRLLPFRVWIVFSIHTGLFVLSYLLSLYFLSSGDIDPVLWETVLRTLPPLLLLRTAVYYHYDLHQGLWRYVSFDDLLNIIRATAISSILFYLLGIPIDRLRLSEKQYLLEFILCLLLVGGTRVVVRNVRERFIPRKPPGGTEHMALLGPLHHVQPLVKELISDSGSRYHPMAVIDPEKSRCGPIRLHDLPVLSIDDVASRKSVYRKLDTVVFCWPGATRRQLDFAVDRLKGLQVNFKKLPVIEDILSERVSFKDIKDVEIEDLLERAPVQINMEGIRAYIKDKVVLVTGGGGSIGSELCRQIAGFGPKRLVVVERSENNLNDLLIELRDRFPDLPFVASISSINDAPGLFHLMKSEGVEVVFHAAAYKHVPLMEEAPVESAYNNIIGTYNVVTSARQNRVRRFVMISTDKAVNPSNVMGATKRIAEMIVQSQDRSEFTRFLTVRFGNVLGSAGSVIPLFKKQIQAGGPLTVTHPRIERFFMTIPEAVQLVLQAGCMGAGGEIFVLDMGKPVNILKLAEKLISLSGKRPHEDIAIRFTGLRPGEKMYEELFNTAEALVQTGHPRILVALSEEVDPTRMVARVRQIKSLVRFRMVDELKALFQEMVPGYRTEEPAPGPVNN
jgi:FlaA1/EpsC-like NDP-sugar epimerase